MKRCLLVVLAVFLTSNSFSQEGLKLGLQAGLPFNDFNDAVSVVVGIETGYMFGINEFLDLGVSAGYLIGIPETFQSGPIQLEYPTMQFLPLAASVRIWPSNSFSFGGEVGQAIGLNEGNDGGFYYRPMLGYLMGPQTEINLSFTAINMDIVTWNTVTLGVIHTFSFD
ncbi:hypothetical protein [Eudoraea chungangensis]|uniref:hypothetical protein n=1 Tax=Eudoraea chungangensis TaxID=1481905 RepID=UPI0023EBA764|nr:hypothetical protein [Eudoraea chungangensis]